MELKFNSQVCTNIEQSKKLLELGLKPETADMAWCGKMYWGDNQHIPSEERLMHLFVGYESNVRSFSNRNEVDVIPAWSLHRLIDLLHVNHIEFVWKDGCYEQAIQMIKKRIEDGFIPKEYLNK